MLKVLHVEGLSYLTRNLPSQHCVLVPLLKKVDQRVCANYSVITVHLPPRATLSCWKRDSDQLTNDQWGLAPLLFADDVVLMTSLVLDHQSSLDWFAVNVKQQWWRSVPLNPRPWFSVGSCCSASYRWVMTLCPKWKSSNILGSCSWVTVWGWLANPPHHRQKGSWARRQKSQYTDHSLFLPTIIIMSDRSSVKEGDGRYQPEWLSSVFSVGWLGSPLDIDPFEDQSSLKRFGVEPLLLGVEPNQLRWFGHLLRMLAPS